MAKRKRSDQVDEPTTVKLWLGGKKYQLTEEQHDQMNSYVMDGKLSDNQEERALSWLSDNAIQPIPESVDPTQKAKTDEE